MINAIIEELLLEESTRGLADKSYGELKRNLNRFALWCEERIFEMKAITPQLFLTYLLDNFEDKGTSTKKSVVWSLRKFGAFLAFHHHLDNNPASALKHPKARPREKLPEYLSEREMRQLLLHCAKSKDSLKFTLVSLFLNTGLRPGDLEGITLFQYFPKRGYFTGIAKGRQNKQTPLSDSMILILDKYIENRQDLCGALLVNRHKKALKVPTMRQLVKEAAKEAGLTREVTPRMLRHTFATHLTDRHGTVMCKALLGHGSLRNTRVYSHLSPRRFRQVINLHPFNSEAHLYE